MSDANGLIEPLSEREMEILACLVEGLSNREIATRLYLSYGTVRWYNTQMYSKLGVSTRDEAVERAIALGLLDTESDDIPPDAGKHNLPESVTSFVGRKHEIHDLCQLLDDDDKRLITILAPGGMGKTRLSIEVARKQTSRFSDGVYFVPLAPLSSPDDIVTTIAENIGFAFHGEQPPTVQVVNFLNDRNMLLVLDNFEHLLEGVSLVSDIIQSTANIHIIVTSRERLNLRGENVYNLRGLAFPTWETPEDALEYDAVKLFMQSAQRVRSKFELHPDDLEFLAHICRLTAGMPLGIELAAGWVDVLSLEKIADEIQHGIDILETDMRDVPERHRSLRATFERTWNRLTEDEQTVFARLSVFRGGFTLESAEAVASANARHLRKLSQKALVQTEPDDRFGIHELLRQFAAVKLEAIGESQPIRDRHTVYFTEFMAERKRDFATDREYEAFMLIDPDFENIRVAWLRIVDRAQWDQFPKMLYSLWLYCDIRSISPDVIHLFEYAMHALASAQSSAETQLAIGRIKAWSGWFYNDLGSPQKGIDTCKEAIQILQNYDTTEDLVVAYGTIGLIEAYSSNVKLCQSMMETAYHLALELEESPLKLCALFWNSLGKFISNASDTMAFFHRATSTLSNVGNQLWLSGIVQFQSMIAYREGHMQQARDLMIAVDDIESRFNGAYQKMSSTLWLGLIFIGLSDYAQAKQYLRESLRFVWEAGYTHFSAQPMVRIAQLYAYENKRHRATQILSVLSDEHREIDFHHHTTQEHIYDNLLAELKDTMEPEDFALAWERGQRYDISTMIRELLVDLAEA